MWNAIQSDLFEFINTIQNDTTNTLNQVLGDEEEVEEVSILDKLIADLQRSYETYAKPLKETRQKEFDRFKKKFNLSQYSTQIAQVLDLEPEVSRFYAELVPLEITPDEFWARLFFRLKLLTRTGTANFEEDDEEEEEALKWDEDENSDALAKEVEPILPQSGDEASNSSLKIAYNRIKELEMENATLKARLFQMTSKIEELEGKLSQNLTISNISQPVLPALPSSPKPALSAASPSSPLPSIPSFTSQTSEKESSDISSLIKPSQEIVLESPRDNKSTASESESFVDIKEAPKYLASLEDEDDEEGWN